MIQITTINQDKIALIAAATSESKKPEIADSPCSSRLALDLSLKNNIKKVMKKATIAPDAYIDGSFQLKIISTNVKASFPN